MKARCFIVGALVVLSSPWLLPASAGVLDDFFSSVARDTKRRNAWPEPFCYPDRESYQRPRDIMIANGWERQNQLSDFHFEANGVQLNEAGRIRVAWILREAPVNHRTVFVHATLDPQINLQRMQIVQQYMDEIAFGAPAPIIQSHRTDDGQYASQIDAVAKRAAAALPQPTLK